jgi:phosphoserine aminotransferase
MKSEHHTQLDFDYLTGLARSNPSEFERLRMRAIESYIETLPADRQQRMRRLQWRIDQETRNHTPMGACVKLSKMMWDHLLGPGGLVGVIQGAERESQELGEVIPFPFAQRP